MGRKTKKTSKGKPNKSREKVKTTQASSKNTTGEPETDCKNNSHAEFTVDQILDKGEEYIDSFEYELAQKFCRRALELDSDNIRALETSGSLLLELGEPEKAKQSLGRAVELNPDIGHAKYMYLGQLFDGMQAVQCFQKGIEIMTRTYEEQQKNEVAAAYALNSEALTVKDISTAYCSIAELYMTDLCMEENAESECRRHLEQAMELDQDNPEPYQLMASFCLSKDNKEEAKTMIEKSVSLWLPKLQAKAQGDAADDLDPVNTTDMSYSTRISAAQILIEVESMKMASDVLESLLDEDEGVVQVWYLLGWLNYLQGEDYHCNARFYLNKANQVHKKTPSDDQPMLDHITELLNELGPGDNEDNEDATEDVDIEYDSEAEDEHMDQ